MGPDVDDEAMNFLWNPDVLDFAESIGVVHLKDRDRAATAGDIDTTEPWVELDVIDPAISLKGVLKEGVLQEKDGFGLAVEASALLPSSEKGEGRFGFEGIAILSDKLGPFTFHLNGGLGIERSTGDLVGIWGVTGELPVAKGLRLVGEVNGEKPRREDQRDSALLGVIWQPWSDKNLWLDAGIRRGFTGATPD